MFYYYIKNAVIFLLLHDLLGYEHPNGYKYALCLMFSLEMI